jgi:hypothetical protein
LDHPAKLDREKEPFTVKFTFCGLHCVDKAVWGLVVAAACARPAAFGRAVWHIADPPFSDLKELAKCDSNRAEMFVLARNV